MGTATIQSTGSTAGGAARGDVGKEPALASTHTSDEPTRRDFLMLTTGAMGAVGAAAALWPFIDQMNPDASTRALASVEVDVGAIEPGQAITVPWRGKPVFIRNRTPEEIEAAKQVPVAELRDPVARNDNGAADAVASDENRAAPGKENFLILVGVCTHLGCIPLGQQGDFGGWFCPCHGSHYDTSGRIRKGPAPENLLVPVYTFVSDTRLRIG